MVVAEVERLIDGSGVVGAAERLRVLERVRRWVEAEIAEVIAEAEEAGAHRRDGHMRVGGWCRAHVRWSSEETMARVRTARLLRDLTGVRDRFAAGEIGVAQVQELARAYANPRAAGLLPEFVEVLVGHAMSLPFEEEVSDGLCKRRV